MSGHIGNIAAHLPVRAREQPYRHAVVFPHGRDRQGRVSYTHCTYRQLDRWSNTLAHGLGAVGLRRGSRTVLMVPPSLEFFALTFALFKMGAVPVLVDPGMGVGNLSRCLAEAEPEAFIGIGKAHLGRLLFGWAKKTLKLRICVGPGWGWSDYSFGELERIAGRREDAVLEPTQADETAAILFTSGSTGVPKGAVYTHGIFAAQVEMLRTLFGIEAGEIDLCTFPLFALFAPALGMTAIVPEMDFTRPAGVDPWKIREAIENFGATNLFGSPALLNRVSLEAEKRGWRFPSLRRVLSAGAPVSAAILERCAGMIAAPAQVFTPYGATEALPVACIGSVEILRETRQATATGAGVCVGQPVSGVEVAIVPIADGPLPVWSEDLLLSRGEIGEIIVKGPIVTREYYRRPDLTTLAKIHDPRDGGVWHRMGDVGYLDEQGRLWFCGRKSQRVRTASGTLFTVQCEGVFNVHPAVYRTALVGVGPVGQQKPVLCVELKPECRWLPGEPLRRELLELGQRQSLTRDIRTFLFHPAFPVDIRHNAKIFREKLAEWAARQTR